MAQTGRKAEGEFYKKYKTFINYSYNYSNYNITCSIKLLF